MIWSCGIGHAKNAKRCVPFVRTCCVGLTLHFALRVNVLHPPFNPRPALPRLLACSAATENLPLLRYCNVIQNDIEDLQSSYGLGA